MKTESWKTILVGACVAIATIISNLFAIKYGWTEVLPHYIRTVRPIGCGGAFLIQGIVASLSYKKSVEQQESLIGKAGTALVVSGMLWLWIWLAS